MPDKEQKIVFVRMREFEARDRQNPGGDQERWPNTGALMRTATTVEALPAGTWDETVDFVVEAEKLGLDVCWVAEAWGSDAPSALGYLAARTDRMLLGSGVMQVGTRSPVVVAQTAITLSNLSGGRFLLGLGASGPQVIEGLHGLSVQPGRWPGSARPSTSCARCSPAAKISYSGNEFQIPASWRRGGAHAVVDAAEHPHPDLPGRAVAGDAAVDRADRRRLAGHQLRSGRRRRAYFAHLDEGLAAAGRTRADIDICQGAEVAFATDEDELRGTWLRPQNRARLQPGRHGFGDAPTSTTGPTAGRAGPTSRRRCGSAGSAVTVTARPALVTDEMVLATTLIGTEEMVRVRLRCGAMPA